MQTNKIYNIPWLKVNLRKKVKKKPCSLEDDKLMIPRNLYVQTLMLSQKDMDDFLGITRQNVFSKLPKSYSISLSI